MIYPTRLAVLIAAGIAPLALLIALAAPAWWPGGLLLLALLLVALRARCASIGVRASAQAEVTCEAAAHRRGSARPSP